MPRVPKRCSYALLQNNANTEGCDNVAMSYNQYTTLQWLWCQNVKIKTFNSNYTLDVALTTLLQRWNHNVKLTTSSQSWHYDTKFITLWQRYNKFISQYIMDAEMAMLKQRWNLDLKFTQPTRRQYYDIVPSFHQHCKERQLWIIHGRMVVFLLLCLIVVKEINNDMTFVWYPGSIVSTLWHQNIIYYYYNFV